MTQSIMLHFSIMYDVIKVYFVYLFDRKIYTIFTCTWNKWGSSQMTMPKHTRWSHHLILGPVYTSYAKYQAIYVLKLAHCREMESELFSLKLLQTASISRPKKYIIRPHQFRFWRSQILNLSLSILNWKQQGPKHVYSTYLVQL